MNKPILLSAILLSSFTVIGCATQSGQDGAVLGGLLGAGAGAIIGNQSGDAGEGLLIGAGLGAIAGGLIGDSTERNRYTTKREVIYTESRPTRTVITTREPIRRAGHYEIRLVRSPSGETYEERVWVYDN
jgi:uncharacterized protein YcfJ